MPETTVSERLSDDGLVRKVGIGVGVALFLALVTFGPLRGSGMLPLGNGDDAKSDAFADLPASPPVVLSVPRLKVSADVSEVSVGADRTLLPPRAASKVGWWSGGASPGDDAGRTVIAGHTVHTGGGALDGLKRVRSGDRINVRTSNAIARYEVDDLTTYSKTELADRAGSLFSADGPAKLVVVSCDRWDGEAYEANVVATATPVSIRPLPSASPDAA